jgi:signal transduction histidine kinase
VNLLSRLYIGTLLVSAVGVWWIILSQESRELTARELLQSMHYLEVTRKELVESEKLALLGSLVAGVAHEINNPVGISVSAASFLRDRTESVNAALAQGKLSREELLHYLDEAGESSRLLLSNARRAADLVQTFKRVAVDQASEQRRRFDLRSYIEETLLGVRGKLKEAGASVRLDCPVGVELDSYPGAFAQVLTNLLLNSIQHGIPTGRSAEIRIDVHTLGTEAVELRYADNGPGIPPALYERVFEPFFSTRRGSGGTGLGLHIAYNLVTRTLGGSISLVTGPKGAAVFVLRLPRTSPGRADIAGTHAVVRRSDEDA